MRLLTEGSIYDHDVHEPPYFCPVCGRPVTLFTWVTVDKKGCYPSYVCYGGRGRLAMLWSRLMRVLFSSEPYGAHYEYEMPYQKFAIEPNFDGRTGRPLR